MASSISVKLAFADDIRKVSFENLTMKALHDKIRVLYAELENSSLDDLYLYYVDEDNDKIRVKFDLELTEAVRQTNGSRVLKIFIINLDSSSTINPTPIDDAASIIPFINLLASISSIPVQSSVSSNAPLFSSMLFGTPQSDTSIPESPVLSSADFTHINKSTRDSSVCVSPNYNSVSTNTLIDAKDVSTETPMLSTTQTTQTCQSNIQPNTHQTTQTQHNASCATQTAQKTQNTQDTQTAQKTQNTQDTQTFTLKTQDTQTFAHSTQDTQTNTQNQEDPVESTPSGDSNVDVQPPVNNFYASLAGTQFGILLEKLQELGFSDKEKCVQALAKYSGKLDEAIDELLLDQLLA